MSAESVRLEVLEQRWMFSRPDGGGGDPFQNNVYFITSGNSITVVGTANADNITVEDKGYSMRYHANQVDVSVNGKVLTSFYNFQQFIVQGNGGDDTINIVSKKPALIQQVSVSGGDGNDVIDASAFLGGSINATGDAGDDKITGSAGDDVINGGTGNNALSGGAGNDLFVKDSAGIQGSVGNDVIDGGDGNDTIKYRSLITETTPDWGANLISNVEATAFEVI